MSCPSNCNCIICTVNSVKSSNSGPIGSPFKNNSNPWATYIPQCNPNTQPQTSSPSVLNAIDRVEKRKKSQVNGEGCTCESCKEFYPFAEYKEDFVCAGCKLVNSRWK